MWIKSKEFLELKKKVKTFFSKDIVDILLFGSSAKSKLRPNDIDICIVFRDKINLDKLKIIQETLGERFHVSSLVIDNFFTKPHSLAKSLLLEGYSLFRNKMLSEVYGLDSKVLYSYDLRDLPLSRKVRFVYLLKGRKNEQGIIKKLGGEFISVGAFIIPVNKDSEILEIMHEWEIKFKRKALLFMS